MDENKGIQNTEIAVVEEEVSLDQFTAYQKSRDKILGFVRDKLVPDVDYGLMYDKATKPSLLKPGAEKLCILLNIEPVFINDKETWEMLGGPAGTVSLICFLLNGARKKKAYEMLKQLGKESWVEILRMCAISEGRGSGSLGEKSNMNSNSLVKIVEKRGLVDAVLRVAGLSEMYTQDGGEEMNGNGKSTTKMPADQNQKFGLIADIRGYLDDSCMEKLREGGEEFLKKDHSIKAYKECARRLKEKYDHFKKEQIDGAAEQTAEVDESLSDDNLPADMTQRSFDTEGFDINEKADREGNLSDEEEVQNE